MCAPHACSTWAQVNGLARDAASRTGHTKMDTVRQGANILLPKATRKRVDLTLETPAKTECTYMQETG